MVQPGNTLDGRSKDHREIQLFLGGTQAIEQVEYLVHNPVRARTRAIDLVDHDYGVQSLLKSLGGDEASLGHRAVHRIHQQQH